MCGPSGQFSARGGQGLRLQRNRPGRRRCSLHCLRCRSPEHRLRSRSPARLPVLGAGGCGGAGGRPLEAVAGLQQPATSSVSEKTGGSWLRGGRGGRGVEPAPAPASSLLSRGFQLRAAERPQTAGAGAGDRNHGCVLRPPGRLLIRTSPVTRWPQNGFAAWSHTTGHWHLCCGLQPGGGVPHWALGGLGAALPPSQVRHAPPPSGWDSKLGT